MNPQDPLAKLHPLRAPEAIGWWPPAPGWWLLLVAVLLTVGVIVYLAYKHRRKNAYRRQALVQLHQLQDALQENGDQRLFVSEVNALLKSAALQAYPRTDVAAQHGEPWRAFLNRSLPSDQQLPPEFALASYQQACPELDTHRIHRAAQHWLKHHKAST